MSTLPTPEQLASRKAVIDFVERVGRPVRSALRHIKSEWFGRPDAELQGWIQRGRAIAEISDTMGYRLIMTQTDKEIRWAQAQLEICEERDIVDLRAYLKSLRFLKDFVITTEKNADIASSVLAGRESAIGRDSFVKNAVVGDRA